MDTTSKEAPQTTTAANDIYRSALLAPTAVKRELNNRSLYHFIEYFWDSVSATKFSPNWHIEELCKELEKVAYRVANREPKEYDLIINVPPGSTKTITCSIMFPAWLWTKWYWMRVIAASYSKDLSLESAERCRDLIRSPKFMELYPDIAIKDDKDIKSNFSVVKKTLNSKGRLVPSVVGGGRFSTSVGGTLTGFHGDILIVDDPLNPKQAASEITLATANYWMESTLPTRKTDKEVSTTILIMQRLHQNDPTGAWLAKKDLIVRHICLPGEIHTFAEQVRPPELKQFYKDGLMDPVRLSPKVLAELKTILGQYGYAGQIGQDPVPPGGGMFKVDHLSFIEQAHPTNHHLQIIRYWDKAATQDGGAYTVGAKLGLLRDRKIVVLDIRRGQWNTHEREEIMRYTAEADGRNVEIWIEQEPGSGGKESAEASVRNLMGFVVHTERPTGDKIFRADPFSVQVNNGNVIILKGAWNEAFIEELRYFPFGTYKDQVDAASGAFNKLAQKRFARRIT